MLICRALPLGVLGWCVFTGVFPAQHVVTFDLLEFGSAIRVVQAAGGGLKARPNQMVLNELDAFVAPRLPAAVEYQYDDAGLPLHRTTVDQVGIPMLEEEFGYGPDGRIAAYARSNPGSGNNGTWMHVYTPVGTRVALIPVASPDTKKRTMRQRWGESGPNWLGLGSVREFLRDLLSLPWEMARQFLREHEAWNGDTLGVKMGRFALGAASSLFEAIEQSVLLPLDVLSGQAFASAGTAVIRLPDIVAEVGGRLRWAYYAILPSQGLAAGYQVTGETYEALGEDVAHVGLVAAMAYFAFRRRRAGTARTKPRKV